MKKFLSGVLAASMLMSSTVMANAADDITVMLDGKPVKFDVAPIIENERTMVPIRAIFEALGAEVEWDQAKREVDAKKDDISISFTIGSNVMKRERTGNGSVAGTAISLDSPAIIIDDRTLVPLRAVSEAFGSTVDWVDSTRTVIITSAPEAADVPAAAADPSANIAPLAGTATD